ncbi:MAG: hypothetical protein A3D65_00700 [Candidatus Lloydbacteria bacterium RIFCSPHIGHO2_02_FULL_50_13]|uniref:DUF488 domain-containing protein n=1 Tax=Candidatus Lloydbacteria bacterium RIFCSPHIGHO2_02_FULL_50_13 TaxID=1798661 RepID=A0A1G2DA77_9BACT|nr:MAG: hypothetical protein A3D65_00700 [Candidatus Lloydbacteria bacterium RIFCSPHIGHO2_02_FULL_50_13]
MPTPILYSIGHSNRPLATFLRRLKAHRVKTLVDVRTYPRSAYAPHFNAMPLRSALEAAGIQYLYQGQNLGGKGKNEDFDGAIRTLARMAKKGVRACVLCAEADFRKCHRHLTIEPAMMKRGVEMRHITYD